MVPRESTGEDKDKVRIRTRMRIRGKLPQESLPRA